MFIRSVNLLHRWPYQLQDGKCRTKKTTTFQYEMKRLSREYISLFNVPAQMKRWMFASRFGYYPPIDPHLRTRQLIFESEGFRDIQDELERSWFLEEGDPNMPRFSVHGGVLD